MTLSTIDEHAQLDRIGPTSLELNGIRAGYSTATVLRDVSIAVPQAVWSRCWGRTAPARRPALGRGRVAPAAAGNVLLNGVDLTKRPASGDCGTASA